MRKFDDMKMPGYYSEMDDSEKGLAIGSGNDDALEGTGYALMGIGATGVVLGAISMPPGGKAKKTYLDDTARTIKQSCKGMTQDSAMRKSQESYNQSRDLSQAIIAVGIGLAAAGALAVAAAYADDD